MIMEENPRRGHHTIIFNFIKRNYVLCMQSDRTSTVKNFQESFRVIISKRVSYTIWYKDESKAEISTEAGISRRRPRDAFSINLDCHTSVFQAGITVIMACTEEMIWRAYTIFFILTP